MESEIDAFESVKTVLAKNPNASQREVAQSLNLSLGSTNALLRRLFETGWICIKKVNAHNIQYLVTPEGLKVLAHRSYSYLKRTWKDILKYQVKANEIVKNAKCLGIKEAVIINNSEIEFLFEDACKKCKISLEKKTLSEIKELVLEPEKMRLIIVEEKTDVLHSVKENEQNKNVIVSILEMLV